MAHSDDVIFPVHERPDVEVLRDGTWHPGELRAWFRRPDGWWANVSYRTGVAEQYLDTLPVDRVRPA